MAEEGSAGVRDFAKERFGIGGGDVEVLGGDFVGQGAGFVGISCKDEGAELFEALAREIAALEVRCLLLKLVGDGVDEGSVPGDEDAGARGVLGLGNQIGGGEIGAGGLVGDDNDFAGAGDGVDIDFAEDLPLRQRDEEVAGANDLVDFGKAFDAVSEGGDGLRTAEAIDFGDAELVAGG